MPLKFEYDDDIPRRYVKYSKFTLLSNQKTTNN